MNENNDVINNTNGANNGIKNTNENQEDDNNNNNSIITNYNNDRNNSNKNTNIYRNIIPKVFRLLPLPKDRLLHNWFTKTDFDFLSIYRHIVTSVDEEKKRKEVMGCVERDYIWQSGGIGGVGGVGSG